jgi:hypothetical protein
MRMDAESQENASAPRPARITQRPPMQQVERSQGVAEPALSAYCQRGVVLDDGELWRAEAGMMYQLFQAPGTQPETVEPSIALAGIHWHPSSLELARSTQPDSGRARQQPALLAAGHLNSPHLSR